MQQSLSFSHRQSETHLLRSTLPASCRSARSSPSAPPGARATTLYDNGVLELAVDARASPRPPPVRRRATARARYRATRRTTSAATSSSPRARSRARTPTRWPRATTRSSGGRSPARCDGRGPPGCGAALYFPAMLLRGAVVAVPRKETRGRRKRSSERARGLAARYHVMGGGVGPSVSGESRRSEGSWSHGTIDTAHGLRREHAVSQNDIM